jgi:NAD(P)-dependent dehydrogenase (short-subunit alcohol dehydrogenase family)
MGFLTEADYTAAKRGSRRLNVCVARELAVHHVDINVVNPGTTLTSMLEENSTKQMRNLQANGYRLAVAMTLKIRPRLCSFL